MWKDPKKKSFFLFFQPSSFKSYTLIYGEHGTGKSSLAIAVVNKIIDDPNISSKGVIYVHVDKENFVEQLAVAMDYDFGHSNINPINYILQIKNQKQESTMDSLTEHIEIAAIAYKKKDIINPLVLLLIIAIIY